MRLEDVRYVLVVAEEANLTRAAAVLHVTPPTLSEAVRRIERELSVTLFSRSNRGMELSPEGRRLLPRLRAFTSAGDDLVRMTKGGTGEDASLCVRIGTVVGYGASWLEEVNASKLVVDDTPIEIETGATGWEDVTGGLASGSVEAAILEGPTELDGDLTSILLGSGTRIALMSKDHPLASQSSVVLADLDRAGWPNLSPVIVDQAWFKYWRGDDARGGPPDKILRDCRTPHELMIAIANDGCIALTLEGVREHLGFGDVVHRPVDDIPACPVRLCYRTGRKSRALDSVAQALREVAATSLRA